MSGTPSHGMSVAVRSVAALTVLCVGVATWAVVRLVAYIGLWGAGAGFGRLSLWAVVAMLSALMASVALVWLLARRLRAPRTTLIVLALLAAAAVLVAVIAGDVHRTLSSVDEAIRSGRF
jgi:hypothetical protein